LQTKQNQQGQSAISDSDLIKFWQASDKVVQVACQDKILNSWQMGSGVLISDDGKVLTNQHVVQSSFSMVSPDYCLVMFTKDFDPQKHGYLKQYRATISGFFQDRDAALLKIIDSISKDPNGAVQTLPVIQTFSYFPIVSTVTPQIGDAVYVIGFPESAQLSFSVTKGIISNMTSDGIYFGTDAQIDRGNSGGAALNSTGQLIGLPTWKFVSSGDYRGYILNINSIKLQ
jgi:serine protease Do